MSAALDDAAVLEDDNLVRIDDGGEAMGDDDRRPSHHQTVQGLLHQLLVLRVERRRRLVEQQDLGVLEQRARDGDALLLSAGKHDAALSALRVVALGERLDEVVGVGEARGLLNARVRADLGAVHDVVLDRHGEEHRLLRHKADLHAQPLRVVRLDVDAVDHHATLVHVIEARHQRDRRRLARARGPDNGHRLARHHVAAHAVQHLRVRARGVMEVDVVKGHAALDAVGRDDAAVVVDTGHAVEELEDTARRADRLHELGEDGDERGEGEHGLEREEHVRHEASDGHLVLEDELATIPHRDKDARISGQVGDGGEPAGDPRAALDDEVRDVDLVGIVRDLLLLHHIRAHSADVGQRLIGLGAGISESNELLLREDLHAEPLQEHAHGDDRDEREHHQRQLPVVGEDGDQPDHDLAQRDEPAGQVGSHNHLDDLRVRRQTIQQLSDAHSVEERHVLTKHVAQHERAQPAGAAGGRDGVQHRREKGEHTVRHVDAQKIKGESRHC
mmetsp:Transcript_6267/g.9457  ORF Transcript_6267/g.9457 Transcript_6267/m.9457 type:complete len:503 (+) Transcript_6267:362-1870(+)